MKQSKFTMLLPWWIGIVVCFNGVLSSTLLSDNNIIQVIPPPVKFGVNYDAFDNALGLCEGVLRLQISLGVSVL